MNLSPWIDPRVEKVRAANARAYMLRHGWNQRPFPRPELLLFAGPLADDGEPIELAVPATEGPSDYVQRIIELITSLAVLEDRPAVTVLDEMLQETSSSPVPLPNGVGRGAKTPSTE